MGPRRKAGGALKQARNRYERFLPEAQEIKGVIRKFPVVSPESLNSKQRLAFDRIKEHVTKNRRGGLPLRLHISGESGTGKSFIVHAIRPVLEQQKVNFRIVSLTGNAAYLIGGQTLHNCFCLPYNIYDNTPATGIDHLRRNLKRVSLFFLDEKSMAGKGLN